MNIYPKEISIRELIEGYVDNDEEGVVGYGGRLNIRPKYQREFVYNDKRRDAVINSVANRYPINVMYWAKIGDDEYEVMDGQQRTISICRYITGVFAIEYKYFHTLPKDKQDELLNYKLLVYICEGTESEKLAWFEIVNIAGLALTKQELRNIAYTGTWLFDAKRHFSKKLCAAYQLSSDYVSGAVDRQEFLEAALKWISNEHIEDYMAKHQHDANANELWLYFQSVINWIQVVFPIKRKEMKSVDWGILYNEHKDESFDSAALETKIAQLMMDDDVTKKSGIYPYVITNDEKYLNIRAFSPAMKRAAYERQKGVCPICKKHFEIDEMEGDHITPWSQGGKTNKENCKMLCKECNRRKSDI